jgi:F-type H+-transporting ATPase subunit a
MCENKIKFKLYKKKKQKTIKRMGNTNLFRDVASPLDQFEIRNLLSIEAPIMGDINLSITNIGLYLLISTFIIITTSILTTNYNKIISNSWSISQESLYATIHSIVTNQINSTKGQLYFPFIYSLFLFILINNLIGLVPYSFASTSHFILAFGLSFTVVLGATILGFQKHGLEFFSLLVPAGCPLGLLPLLVLIEFISYLARSVSLGLRLAANILSGHMLLNILAGFTYNIMTSGFIFFFLGLLPLAFIIAFCGLELGIAFIQAQVFVVLTSSYIKDGLDLH